MDIFKMTDGVGQTLTVEPTIIGGYAARVTLARPGWIRVTLLRAEDVDRLREVLAPLGTQREAAPLTIKVGREYRALPGACYRSDGRSRPSSSLGDGERVRVMSGPDGDGDYWVCVVGGEKDGNHAYVSPEYLAPLDEPPADEAVQAPADLEVQPDLDPRRVVALQWARTLAGPDALPEDVLTWAAWLIGDAQ